MRYVTSRRRWEEARAIAPTLAAGADRMRKGWFHRSSAAVESGATYTSINAFSDEPTPSLDLNPERNARLHRRVADQSSNLPPPASPEAHRHVTPTEFDLPSADIGDEPMADESPANDFADRGFDFDDSTENSSREIAKRFAPASATAMAKDLDKARVTSAQMSTPSRASAPAVAAKPVVSNGLLAGLARNRVQPQWKRPSLNMLKRPSVQKPRPELSQTVMRGNARLLEDVLADFGIKARSRTSGRGPVVTLYELEPSRGTKSSRVIGLLKISRAR